MTLSERNHIRRAVEMGCALCRHLGIADSPAEYHHQRDGTGAGRRASHFEGFPLCPLHHRLGNDALHVLGRKAWEEYFHVTEKQFVDQTQAALFKQ
jgi:hypothetical protein